MMDIIIVAAVVLVVVLASLYIYKAKKNGQKCIGCPSGRECGGKCGCTKEK